MSSLERNPMGRWVWTDAHGARHEQVIVVRAYPVTAPEQGVGIMDAEGHELAWFDRLDQVTQRLQSSCARRLPNASSCPRFSA